MNETDLMNSIRLELSRRGFTVFRANVGKFTLADGRWFDVGLPKGFSDLFAVKDGRIYFLETKVRPNTPTAEQLQFIDRMRKQGCRADVVYSVDEAVALCS